jgi:hypothetical protein
MQVIVLCFPTYLAFVHNVTFFKDYLEVLTLLKIHVQQCLAKVDYFKIMICSFTLQYLHIIRKPNVVKD